MRIEGDDIVFKSGRRVESACNMGIIGLSPELDDITEGYDGSICMLVNGKSECMPVYSREERCEICDYMIKLWKNAKKIINA